MKIIKSPEMVINGPMPDVEGPDNDKLNRDLVQAESDLHRIELEEDRLIRLLVSGKITEVQFDRQRKFITERLEAARQTVNTARGRIETIRTASEVGDVVKAWTSELK